MKKQEQTPFPLRRVLVCVVGMFIYASGVALTKNCNIGISPIVSVAYAMSLITGITLGWCTTIYNLVLFALQRLLLGKEYTWKTMLAQLVMSMFFSIFIDLAGVLWSFVQPSAYVMKIVVFVVGCAVLAAGMSLVVFSNFVTLPAEGAVVALGKTTGKQFGTVKICFDGASVALTAVLSLLFLGKITGLREGTILAVLLIGPFSKPIHAFCDKRLSPVLEP